MNNFEYLYEDFNRRNNTYYRVIMRTFGNWENDENFVTDDFQKIVDTAKKYDKMNDGFFYIQKGDSWTPVDSIRFEYHYHDSWNPEEIDTNYLSISIKRKELVDSPFPDYDAINALEEYIIKHENAKEKTYNGFVQVDWQNGHKDTVGIN